MTSRRTRSAGAAATIGTLLLGATLAACGGGEEALGGSDRAEVLRVASDRLETLFSYDASRLAQDRDEIDGVAAGDLRAEYRAALSGENARSLRALGVSTAATVVDIGLADADSERPVVLAYLRRTTTSSASASPTVETTAVEATLSTVDGSWRLLRLAPVAGTGASDDDD